MGCKAAPDRAAELRLSLIVIPFFLPLPLPLATGATALVLALAAGAGAGPVRRLFVARLCACGLYSSSEAEPSDEMKSSDDAGESERERDIFGAPERYMVVCIDTMMNDGKDLDRCLLKVSQTMGGDIHTKE